MSETAVYAHIHKTCLNQILSQVLSFELKCNNIFYLKVLGDSKNS